jgi:hypothetical protein
MRWNCPHCGTNLAIADEKVGNGWSFSRCYKCAGFSLVRRSDVTLIKVDRAPEGEQVLLPEAHENPMMMLSENATRNLQRYAGAGSETGAGPNKATPTVRVKTSNPSGASAGPRPVIRTASPRGGRPVAQQQARQAQGPAFPPRPERVTTTQIIQPLRGSALGDVLPQSRPSSAGFGLPEPLPDEPERTLGQRLVPMGIGLAGMLTIGSGIYLYVQGQALFEKARTQARESSAPAPAAPGRFSAAGSENESIPLPGREVVIPPARATAAAARISAEEVPAPAPTNAPQLEPPIAVPVVPVAATQQARSPGKANLAAGRGAVVDQVRSRAMAPLRPKAHKAQAKKPGATPATAPPAAREVRPEPAIVPSLRKASKPY